MSLGMVWRYSLFLAKEIITPYHAVQKTITKDQHALACRFFCMLSSWLSAELEHGNSPYGDINHLVNTQVLF